MAVNVTSVGVHNNPAQFNQPFAFEIEYECLYQLQDDLEWKMIYVGSAESDKYDQVLDSVLVGPVYAGNYRFVFEANAPDTSKIPADDIVGLAVILLTCSYKTKEFIRIGYYINNEYTDEQLKESPPDPPQPQLLMRSILADHPRVTRFPVDFDNDTSEVPAMGDAGMGVEPSSTDPGNGSGMAMDQSPGAAGHGMPQQQEQRGGMTNYFPPIGQLGLHST